MRIRGIGGRGIAALMPARTGILALALAVLAVALAGCGPFGGSSSTSSSTTLSLSQVPWCVKPSVQFQDYSQTDQATITDWSQVRGQLGFTPYLPPTLPKGSCIVLAGGSIHDPIYHGGHLSLTYSLPGGDPVSLSEAPKPAGLDSTLQCTQSPAAVTGGTVTPKTPVASATATATPQPQTTVCIGSKGSTTITIAARQAQSDVKTLFNALKSDVDWQPSATTPTAASTTSPTSTTAAP